MKKILLITFCILSLCGCEEKENLQGSSKSSKIEENYTTDNNSKSDSKLEDVKINSTDKSDKANNNAESNKDDKTNNNSSIKSNNNSSKTTNKSNNSTTKKNTDNSSSKKSSPADTNANANTRLPLKAICKDGSISYQDNPEGETYRGMCSHHGGIKTKLGRVK